MKELSLRTNRYGILNGMDDKEIDAWMHQLVIEKAAELTAETRKRCKELRAAMGDKECRCDVPSYYRPSKPCDGKLKT